jgi:UDP-N-acetylglucosamine 2-epimerase (non-hydrolysing)
VDALEWISARLDAPPDERRLVLVTSHRRESFGEPMRRAFRAIGRLARSFPDLEFVFPVHPNPNVRAAAEETLASVPNVRCLPPADYPRLVGWMRSARLVITDSGGLQEETPAFGVPTLVLRETTERPEGVEAGVAVLVGTDDDLIYRTGAELLSNPVRHAAMARRRNPYGDGRAAERIAALLTGRGVEPFSPGS